MKKNGDGFLVLFLVIMAFACVANLFCDKKTQKLVGIYPTPFPVEFRQVPPQREGHYSWG